jgi:DNA-binding cell septation regulator SpoVG/16S rRNA G966 N2-methylase RsmD
MKIPITGDVMRIDTAKQSFDMQEIENRRFMFNPQTGTLILGKQYPLSNKELMSSHSEEHYEARTNEPFDSFVQGWVGTGARYESGVIHFTPPLSKKPHAVDKGFSVIEMFVRNGADENTIARGFPGEWEQPLSNILDVKKIRTEEKLMINNSSNKIDPFKEAPDFCSRLMKISGIDSDMLTEWVENAFSQALISEEDGVPQNEAQETALNEFAEAFEKIELYHNGIAAEIFNFKAGYAAHELYDAARFIAEGGTPAEALNLASSGAFEGSVAPESQKDLIMASKIQQWYEKIGQEFPLRGNENFGKYTVLDVPDGETLILRRDDGYRLEAHLPQLNPDSTIEWAYSSNGYFEQNLPLYLETLSYARENGEVELFKESKRLNEDCAKAIDKAISKHSTLRGMPGAASYDFDTSLKEVTDIFGQERVTAVIATIPLAHTMDGRISERNKEWAKSIDVPKVQYIIFNTHLAVLDGFTDYVRKAHQTALEQERAVSVEKQEKAIILHNVQETVQSLRDTNEAAADYFSEMSEPELSEFIEIVVEMIYDDPPYLLDYFENEESIEKIKERAEGLIMVRVEDDFALQKEQEEQKITLKKLIDNELGENTHICVYNEYGDFLCEGEPEDLRKDGFWAFINEDTVNVHKSGQGLSESGKEAVIIHLSNFLIKERAPATSETEWHKQLKAELGDKYKFAEHLYEGQTQPVTFGELKVMLENGTLKGQITEPYGIESKEYGELDGKTLWSLQAGDMRIDLRISQYDMLQEGKFGNSIDFHIYSDVFTKVNEEHFDMELAGADYKYSDLDITKVNSITDLENQMFETLDKVVNEYGLRYVKSEKPQTFLDFLRSDGEYGDYLFDGDVIVGDVEMNHALVWDVGADITDYCYEQYADLLNSPYKIHDHGNGYEVIEVFCDDYEMGKDFFAAAAGYIADSEHKKMFIEIDYSKVFKKENPEHYIFEKLGEWTVEDILHGMETNDFPDGISVGDSLFYMEKGEFFIDVSLSCDFDDNFVALYEIGRIDELGKERNEDYMVFDLDVESVEHEMSVLIENHKKEQSALKNKNPTRYPNQRFGTGPGNLENKVYNNLTEEFTMENNIQNNVPKITVRVTPIENGSNLKGTATVTIGDQIAIHGVKIVQGEKGLFVSMPSEKGRDDKFYDTVLPKSKEASAIITEKTLAAYQDALVNGKQQKSDLNPTELSVKVSNLHNNTNSDSGIRANCQITINDMLVIKGVKVIVNGKTGELGVALPSKQDENGGYIPVANAITTDFYAQIKNTVINHYQNPPKTLGNTSYGKLADKSQGEEILHKTYNSQFAEKVGEQLDANDVRWSAKLEGNGKTVIAVNKNDAEKLNQSAETAKELAQGNKNKPEAPEVPEAPAKKTGGRK